MPLISEEKGRTLLPEAEETVSEAGKGYSWLHHPPFFSCTPILIK